MQEEINDIDKKQLLDYLNGDLDDATQSAFERQMEADPFLKDAVDGLRPVGDKTNLPVIIEQLNDHLKHQLIRKKSSTRQRKDMKEFPWMYVAVFLILLLSLIGFLLIRYFLKK